MRAERVEQGEVGGFTQRMKTARSCLGLAVKVPWSELGGSFILF